MTRDEKGHFVKGHEKIGGRKSRAVEVAYLKIFKETVSPVDWKAIIERTIKDAKVGDATARKFIADYLIGAPVQKVDTNISGKIKTNSTINIKGFDYRTIAAVLAPRPVQDSDEPSEGESSVNGSAVG